MKFQWANCRLDTESRTLLRGGEPVPTQALPFDLLALLLRHRGRVLSDAYIRRTLWPDVRVSDASLRQVVKAARRAIGDDGRTQTAIETVRGRGLRFVAPVTNEGGAGARFVGRADVLAALERELDEAESGRGGVTLLAGRAGIGKSSTLGEIVGRAVARGWRVLEAWGRPGAESDPCALWAGVVGALGVPLLAEASAALPPSAGVSDASRFAHFRTLEAALACAAREQPMLLCFDDLQLADHESLALLRFLAPAVRGMRLRIVGGHRPVPQDDVRMHALAALAADSAASAFELRGLDSSEIRSLVAVRLGTQLSREAAEALAAQADGSPLLALEVARALLASGAALAPAGPEQIAASVALGIVPLVRRRLAPLDPATRRALHAAATLGDPFEAAPVAAVADLASDGVERALREAERASLIERHGPHGWRFAHPLFAEAVAEDLSALGGDAETALHVRVFEALDAARGPDPFRVATRALRARAHLAPAVIVDRLRRAALAALRLFAVADAQSWQQRAVDVAEAAGFPPLERCDLLLELGALTIPNAGVIDARRHFDRAARIARDHGDGVRLARAALGYAHRAFVIDAQESVLVWLRAAHATPCGDDALEARVAARLGAELLTASPADRAAAERLLRDGVERTRRLGQPLDVARALADQSIATFGPADPRAAIALAVEVASCGRHAGDAEIEFRGLAEVATLHLELGDRAGLDVAIEVCADFAQRVPVPYMRGVVHGMEAMRALLDGRLDDASAAMDEADRFARSTGSLGFGVIAGLQRFLLARERGGLAVLAPIVDQFRARFPQVPGLGAVAGVVHARCGNDASADDAADRLLAGLDALPFDRTRLATLAVGAELAYLVRSAPLAEALDPLLAPFSALHAAVGNAACYFGSIAHAQGYTAAARGRIAGALAHFARARDAHQAIGSPPWVERSADAAAEIRRRARGLKLVC